MPGWTAIGECRGFYRVVDRQREEPGALTLLCVSTFVTSECCVNDVFIGSACRSLDLGPGDEVVKPSYEEAEPLDA